jgi:hypothetical protein
MSIPATEATTPTRTTAPRGGSISTEEIKARIEAMFADELHEPEHLSR